MGEFPINPVYKPAATWIRTGTASNGHSSISIQISSTLSHYSSNLLALRSMTTHLQRSRLLRSILTPNKAFHSPRTKVQCSKCQPSSTNSSRRTNTTVKQLAAIPQPLQQLLGRGHRTSQVPSGRLRRIMQLLPRRQLQQPQSLPRKHRLANHNHSMLHRLIRWTSLR